MFQIRINAKIQGFSFSHVNHLPSAVIVRQAEENVKEITLHCICYFEEYRNYGLKLAHTTVLHSFAILFLSCYSKSVKSRRESYAKSLAAKREGMDLFLWNEYQLKIGGGGNN